MVKNYPRRLQNGILEDHAKGYPHTGAVSQSVTVR